MSLYNYEVKDAKGNKVSLEDYRGKVLLIVNTATGCGLAPQYDGLQDLYDKYKEKGFVILDFPCNQFANQSPGTEAETVSLCSTKYGITFPMFSMINVNGKDEEPLYTYLKSKQNGIIGSSIKWNFTKFLIDKEGNVVERFAPTTKPEKLDAKIASLL
ncbi:MAG: Glutathione peroxidase [Clostridiales bacterium]|jgi:glutathione peroxidase|nr:Glutathione peroxidase [Clostridiales bacterium]